VKIELCIKQYLEKHGFEALCPKAVLFDMDGVLYDSMPNHAIAWEQSMKEYGIVMTHEDAYATEGQRGVDTIRQMVKQQQGRDISEEEAQEMYNLKTHIFHEMKKPPMMPGALELMQKIHDNHLTIGVVTGSGQRPLIARLLHDYGDFVDDAHIVTAYDIKKGKPHPDPYLMGLQKAGNLKPWEAFVVENAPLGIRAGVAARIFTIAVNTGNLPSELLMNEGANLLMDSMEQLCYSASDIFRSSR
jgi:HAD superfamily hydrolase (TIGR01509 family)